ncbi:MAG: NAD(P)H-hydrate epimerase, partial [Actinomycetia bacterium]|nr:NAD(P)H-hydrate epimerase [Actinomycetes bacterium]
MDAVLSVAEMQRVDARAADRADALMDAAGFSVAMSAATMDVAYGTDVHVLAGRGNNGGDGYVAARYLARRGALVTVHHDGMPEPDTVAGRAMHAAQASGIRMRPMGDVVDGDLIIDALYGTGFRGELPEVAIPWTVTDIPVLSVDIPSGVSGDSGLATGPAFRAQRTATFHMFKTGHLLGDGPDMCGTIDLYDIGLRG